MNILSAINGYLQSLSIMSNDGGANGSAQCYKVERKDQTIVFPSGEEEDITQMKKFDGFTSARKRLSEVMQYYCFLHLEQAIIYLEQSNVQSIDTYKKLFFGKIDLLVDSLLGYFASDIQSLNMYEIESEDLHDENGVGFIITTEKDTYYLSFAAED